MAKKLRRMARKEAAKIEMNVLPDLKKFLNGLPLKDRIKAAWRLTLGKL